MRSSSVDRAAIFSVIANAAGKQAGAKLKLHFLLQIAQCIPGKWTQKSVQLGIIGDYANSHLPNVL
jgi:hypothetical protein